MTPENRSKIIEAAMRLREIPYDDAHDGQAWKDLAARPRALDCSAFVCRVAADAGLFRPGMLAPKAAWLLDYFVEIPSPSVGDLVGYGRPALCHTNARFRDVVWHVMISAGNGDVIGAYDIARRVVVRPMKYERELGSRQWRLIEPSSFRALRVIS
jgi:hypothetical protein